MTRQVLSGSFGNTILSNVQFQGGASVDPTTVPFLCDVDILNVANEPQRTKGQTIAVDLTPSPQINSTWELLSVAISGALTLANITVDQSNHYDVAVPFGKFGSIIAGLVVDGNLQLPQVSTTQGNIFTTFIQPLQPYPLDTSLLTPLWDPTIDDMPPIALRGNTQVSIATPNPLVSIDGTPLTLAIRANLLFPIPLQVIPGRRIQAGIWMNPSVLGVTPISSADTFGIADTGLTLLNLNYSATYDDGL